MSKYYLTKDKQGYKLWSVAAAWCPVFRPAFGVWEHNIDRLPLGQFRADSFERCYPHLKMRAGKYARVEIEPLELKAKK